MAKFVNNSKTATIARRAAAAGLSLPTLAEALHKVSGREAADGANFGPSGDRAEARFLRELAASPLWNQDPGQAWVDVTPTSLSFNEVDSRTAALRQTRWELDPSGDFYVHTGGVDEEAGDRYQQQFDQQGYLLFPGVRQRTAEVLGVACDNSFHWAFDLVVGGFSQYHQSAPRRAG